MAKDKKTSTPQDPAELAKIPLPGGPGPAVELEEGALPEPAAAQAAPSSGTLSAALPGAPDFRRRILETRTFSWRGQIVTWRAGDVRDFAGYGGQAAIDLALAAGIQLGQVAPKA